MAVPLEILEKDVQIVHLHPKHSFGEKIKEKERNQEGKIYSPVGNLAERAK